MSIPEDARRPFWGDRPRSGWTATDAPKAIPDILQRHLLCAATGMHDRGPDGCCRDCTKPLSPDDAVCEQAGGWSLPDTAPPVTAEIASDAAGWRDAHDTLMGLMARGLRGNR